MRKTFILLLLCLVVNSVSAQRITHRFHDVSMTEALQYIQSQTQSDIINYIANELEDFRVTTEVKNKSITDAILQIAGFYPVRVLRGNDHKIYVECTHKTNHHLTGTIIDENRQPVPYANVYLLHPSDSTVIGGGVSNEAGVFVIQLIVYVARNM